MIGNTIGFPSQNQVRIHLLHVSYRIPSFTIKGFNWLNGKKNHTYSVESLAANLHVGLMV